MTLKFEVGLDFLTMNLPTKFHHCMFNRHKLSCWWTNRDPAENIHLAPLCHPSGK